jgi:dTDP-4-dehydrorhamnose 3,5-epimerase
MKLIDGVKITRLKQFIDERGKVMHMLRNDWGVYSKFGEIYFSCTNPNVVKAWHLHKEMTLNYAVITGCIKCVLYDDRKDSLTRGEINEFFMSPEDYYLLTVPPLIWNGWKGVGTNISIVANCATIPHSNDEIIRKSPFDKSINYNWDVKNK